MAEPSLEGNSKDSYFFQRCEIQIASSMIWTLVMCPFPQTVTMCPFPQTVTMCPFPQTVTIIPRTPHLLCIYKVCIYISRVLGGYFFFVFSFFLLLVYVHGCVHTYIHVFFFSFFFSLCAFFLFVCLFFSKQQVHWVGLMYVIIYLTLIYRKHFQLFGIQVMHNGCAAAMFFFFF